MVIFKNTKSSGITLIALVVTIIVLLILAGISISMLSGDNSILQKATDAKTETEKGQEKEIVALAYNSALAKKVSSGDSTEVTSEDMNTELTNQGATSNGSNPIKVTFTNSKRQYSISVNGEIRYIGIQPEEEIISDDIFVALYNDGTLVFSSKKSAIDSSKVSQDFGNIKDEHFSAIQNTVNGVWENVPLWSWNTNITKVKILNKIYPQYLSAWFLGLLALTEIENIENIDTSSVTDMSGLFSYCGNLTSLDLSNFNTSNVTNMQSMFDTCTGLTNLNISKFDTSKVINMKHMFYVNPEFDLSSLEKIYVGTKWTTANVEQGDYMFYGCNKLVGGNGTTYTYEHLNSEYAHLDGWDGPGYFTFLSDLFLFKGKNLSEIATYNESTDTWTFNDNNITFVEWSEQYNYIVVYYEDAYFYFELDANKKINSVGLD